MASREARAAAIKRAVAIVTRGGPWTRRAQLRGLNAPESAPRSYQSRDASHGQVAEGGALAPEPCPSTEAEWEAWLRAKNARISARANGAAELTFSDHAENIKAALEGLAGYVGVIEGHNQILREAIADALVDLTPGIAPYTGLRTALDRAEAALTGSRGSGSDTASVDSETSEPSA